MRSVKTAPTSPHGGRPAAKSSSITHWRNGSATTGQRSSMPRVSCSHSRSASAVTGVMRSTIEFGNVQLSCTHSTSAAPARAAAASMARRAASPLPGRLSQLRIVSGPAPRSRRTARAAARRSKVDAPEATCSADGSA
jgi:hypothetical protein